ncbi:hypothetical protein UDIV_4520 [Ureaplasma diversum NCTC 246]|uniref:Uncharacterized protein n=1 Tax=Ureaplasma diversum NCTC 246 TaxID=1188241 RepID=A0A084EYB4_9BACT|nr:hypothetical protein UDIV_4520 [Ureaplasma diversum NCTC 246]
MNSYIVKIYVYFKSAKWWLMHLANLFLVLVSIINLSRSAKMKALLNNKNTKLNAWYFCLLCFN